MSTCHECQKCGLCCRELPVDISASDIRRWLQERRTDILRQISWVDNYPHKGTGGFFFLKTIQAPKQPCPFLDENNLCSIYETRPRVCADFPYGHDIWKPCPAWEKIGYYKEQRKDRRAKKVQLKDFKDAHDNRHQLLKKIIEGRRGQFG